MENLKHLCNQETERAALGCMFLDRGAALMGIGSLVPDDFYVPMYRTIFEAMGRVEHIDPITVNSELQKAGEGERVGVEWLSKIIRSVSTSVYLKDYIEELKRLSYFRRCIKAGQEMMQAAYRQETESIDKALSGIRADGYGAGELVTLEDALEEYIKELAEIRTSGKRFLGLETGFIDIDDMLGGLRNGTLNILAARPSMGKSALMLDIARNVQKKLMGENEKVVIFSLEMNRKELAARGYTAEYLISNDKFSTIGNDDIYMENLRELEKKSADIRKGLGRLLINDESSMTVEKIRAYLHGLKTKGVDIRLIVLDYLQLVTTKGVNMVQEMGEVSRSLKNLAKDYNCPVLALSQLSRGPEGRADHRPILSDLRESGNIEQDADVVMMLYREEYYFPDCDRHKKGTAEVNIAKQRNGPTGAIRLKWIPECTTFRNLQKFTPTKEKPPKEFEQTKMEV